MTISHRKTAAFVYLLIAGFASSVTMVNAQKPPPPKVVFLGDSITGNWGNPANSNAFQANPKWINQGKGPGLQTSSAMLARFQSDVVSYHPDIVHILAGAVDVSSASPASQPFVVGIFETNIMAMVAQATHANIKVILGTIPPLLVANSVQQPQYWYSFEPTQVLELNAWIHSYGAANNIPVINYHDVLCACAGSINTAPNGYFPLMSQDGASPSPAGYAAITPLIEIALATLNLSLNSGYLSDPGSVNSLPEGNSTQFTAYGMYSDGIPRALLNANVAGVVGAWSSSNPSVMYVGYNGEAFALSPGQAQISFTTLGGVAFAPWDMTVEPAF